MHGFDRSCAVWPRTLWKIPSESARTSWIVRERQKWCTVGIISGKSSKNRSLGAPGQIYCPDNHLSFRRESLAGVPGPDPRSSTPQTRSYDHGLFRTLHSETIAGFCLFYRILSIPWSLIKSFQPLFVCFICLFFIVIVLHFFLPVLDTCGGPPLLAWTRSRNRGLFRIPGPKTNIRGLKVFFFKFRCRDKTWSRRNHHHRLCFFVGEIVKCWWSEVLRHLGEQSGRSWVFAYAWITLGPRLFLYTTAQIIFDWWMSWVFSWCCLADKYKCKGKDKSGQS